MKTTKQKRGKIPKQITPSTYLWVVVDACFGVKLRICVLMRDELGVSDDTPPPTDLVLGLLPYLFQSADPPFHVVIITWWSPKLPSN